MAQCDGLIRSKIRVPTVGGDFIGRPRVQRELHAAAKGRRILLVVASARSGKTTAAIQFLGLRPVNLSFLGEAADTP